MKIIILLAGLFFLPFKSSTEREITIKLTETEWATVIDIMDNAAVAGPIRKPIINKIIAQANEQLVKDSTKPKAKN